MSAEPVVDYLRQRHDAVMARLDAFLRLPSVSTDPAYAQGMSDTRAFLLDWLKGIGLSDVPVSYTHLDVYKRQAQIDPPT